MEFKVGDRVVRGPDWEWGDQDGHGPGTVVPRRGVGMESGSVWVSVDWDNGHRNGYRVGPDVCDLAHLKYGNEEDE